MPVTGVFQKVHWVMSLLSKKFPVLIHKGSTLREARKNLREALELVLATNREIAEENLAETRLPFQREAVEV